MRLLRAKNAVVAAGVALTLASCSGGGVQVGPTSHATATPVPSSTPTPSATSTTTAPATSFTADDWPLFDHDSARSGTSNEVTGTHGAVALNKLWQIDLGDVADSGPIIKGSMLYVTTHNGTTYGIATATGAKVWTFTTSGPNITTSEPAYDVVGNKVYAPGVDGRVHRLDPATGVEDTTNGFPVLVTLATQTEKDASPLNIANGFVYAQTSAYDGDGDPYVGHVIAISTTTGQAHVFNTLCSSQTGLIQPQSCSQQRSGMWSRAGVVVDPDASMSGRAYVATGNATYDPGNGDYGDSVLALASDASSLVANYTPGNAATLDADDLDLGSSSPAILPRQTAGTALLAVQAGKEGMLRLLDRSNLSGTNAVLQTIDLHAGLYSAPAVYANPNGQTFVYVGLPNGVNAYQVTVSNGVSQLALVWTAPVSLGSEGTSPVVRDGIVYVAATNQLVALDATTGSMLASNSALGSVHWESPSIANGTIYCSDQSGNLTAFSIVPGASTNARRHHRVVRRATLHRPIGAIRTGPRFALR